MSDAQDNPDVRQAFPRRVVALGGGSGLPAVLRGLRPLVGSGDIEDLTAIVTMTDDGGSSGRLRQTLGMPPPGDVRNCLVALSTEEDLLAGLFQYRYSSPSDDLAGHTVGNLILAALAEQTGCFLKAVEASSRVLRVAGRILPASLRDVRLCAVLDDGSLIVGESEIGRTERGIRQLSLLPADVPPTDGVLETIRDADLVVLGPGSLFTSILPNLAVRGVAETLADTDARVVLAANLVSERGEAAGLGLDEHVAVIERHAGRRIVDAIVVNGAPIDPAVRHRYREEGAVPLSWSAADIDGRMVVKCDLVERGVPKLRHDPAATAAGLLRAWRAFAPRGLETGVARR